MHDEAERWYYDLGALAEVVQCNEKRSITAQHKADMARRRLWVLAVFVLFASLLLAWRNEISTDRINTSNDRITATQEASCLSGLAILTKFNQQQDALADLERTNPDAELREARIEAYRAVRILPLPICSAR